MKINEELLKRIAKKGSALVLAGSLLLGGNQIVLNNKNNNITTVYAASQNDSEVVNLDVQMGINLYLNDKGFIPTDVNGKQTYPFISDGTTYVPIRAIAQLFNANIKWDEKTNTVKINTSGQEAKLEHTILEKQNLYNVNITAEKGAKLIINGKECIPKDVNGNVKDIYIVNGTTYVPVRAVSETLGLPITWSDLTNSVFIGTHKDYGLTVENINDIVAFEDAVEHFLNVMKPIVWTYEYDGRNYDIIENNLEEFRMAIALVNLDYCSDELLVQLFGDTDNYSLKRIIHISKLFGNAFPTHENHFNYSYCTVDKLQGEFIDSFQNMCHEEYRSKAPLDGPKLVYDYLSGKTNEYDYYKQNTYISWIVASAGNNGVLSKTTEYHSLIREFYYGMTRTHKAFPHEYYETQMVNKFMDRLNKALENQKVKQLIKN